MKSKEVCKGVVCQKLGQTIVSVKNIHYFHLQRKERNMPNMDNGRQKILDFLKENNLTMATLAVQYSMTRQDVTNILNGKLKNPQAHRFVARVIEDFKIR